jgi:hypothetical protein
MIDIANSFGLDNKNWDVRLDWFKQHEDHLIEMLPQAKEPALFYAGIQAWENVKATKPIGYPISLDATASGLQLLAALTGDRNAARLCNVVDTGNREDAYTNVYMTMVNKINEAAKIKRDDTKQAIMTALYGSQAVPREVFGEGPLLKVFFDTMQEVAPAAWELNEAFLDIWDPDALSHDWILPDNFHVHIKVMRTVKETVHFLNEPVETSHKVNAPIEEGRSLGANTIHSLDGLIVREMSRRCDYDPEQIKNIIKTFNKPKNNYPLEDNKTNRMLHTLWNHYKESGYLSARILDYITEDNINSIDKTVISDLIDTLPEKPFKILSVHDCFRVLPNYGNDLRYQYNLQLMLIAKSNMLQYLLSQILNRPVTIGKLDPTLHEDILDANYSLS